MSFSGSPPDQGGVEEHSGDADMMHTISRNTCRPTIGYWSLLHQHAGEHVQM